MRRPHGRLRRFQLLAEIVVAGNDGRHQRGLVPQRHLKGSAGPHRALRERPPPH